jgi:hypothetical protein
VELAFNRLEDVATAGGRTFRLMTLVAAGDCSAQVPVHVESSKEDYEALLGLYKKRIGNLTTIFSAGDPKWLEFLLGVDDAGLMARLDGSVLLSHCEIALLEEALEMCSGDFDTFDLTPADFAELVDISSKMLGRKQDPIQWGKLSKPLRMQINTSLTLFHPLSKFFRKYNRQRIDDATLTDSANNPEDNPEAFVEKLGYASDWSSTHDGSVPGDLGLRLRAAFPEYWGLRDDWISERPCQIIDRIRPELNRRLVAVAVDDDRYPLVPSYSTVHLPLPTLPQRELPENIRKIRNIRLQLLFEVLGSDRTRVLNEMNAVVSIKELKAIFGGTCDVSARLCRHLERFLHLAPGWLDGLENLNSDVPFSVPEIPHALPTAEENVLKSTGAQSKAKGLSKAPLKAPALEPAIAASANERPTPRRRVERPASIGKPVVQKRTPKIIQPEVPDEETPALKRSAETRRLNLEMMTRPDGARLVLARELGWSVGNVDKRLSGQIKMSVDDAELLEEIFKLGVGWMEEVHRWSDLPVKTQQLLAQNATPPNGADTQP